MTYKSSFCTFLWLTRTGFHRLQINVRPKGLHKSLTPDLWPLIPVLSTTVERALQIRPFLTNKANFRKTQMNVNKVLTKDYEQMNTWSSGKNKANSKPIQTQYKPKQTQFLSAISVAGQRLKMLMYLKMNPRREKRRAGTGCFTYGMTGSGVL